MKTVGLFICVCVLNLSSLTQAQEIKGICVYDAAEAKKWSEITHVKPYSQNSNYMSRAGYVRLQFYKATGTWVPIKLFTMYDSQASKP